jgi:transcription termination factor Rho
MTGAEQTKRKRKGSGLESLVLPELKQIASQLGLKGTAGMRKGQLIEAINAAQDGNTGIQAGTRQSGSAQRPAQQERQSSTEQARPRQSAVTEDVTDQQPSAPANTPGNDGPSAADQASASTGADSARQDSPKNGSAEPSATGNGTRERGRGKSGNGRGSVEAPEKQRTNNGGAESGQQSRSAENGEAESGQQSRTAELEQAIREEVVRDRGDSDRRQNGGRDQNNRQRNNNNRGGDDDGGARRGRRRRSRDRQNRRGQRNDRTDAEPTVSDEDVLVPTGGIVDVLDNYAFVRTSGYLPGASDAYVSMALVKKHGLRKGDVITGSVRQPREGERREKFSPLVKVDTINNVDPEQAKARVEFNKLTPLYAQQRLRLETTPNQLTTRLIDLVSPIGKGQRGLIVSPSKAGKTMVMQSIANAITTNNPEVHLMVVLVDERPEEVTDFQRSTNAEVISSTFDRPADDHTTVAELAIERAKRLVELGHDVMILLDGITRLGRAYNLATPASGRILSGGVDSAALYPPKKFFGAARNIENGGSLTILATALIETGSKQDEVIFEEFKGTGNMELRLRREYAEKRIFPAIDVDASSTRREELLMGRDELSIVWKLRRALSNVDGQQALETMLDRLRKTQTNGEFLVAITKTMPGRDG